MFFSATLTVLAGVALRPIAFSPFGNVSSSRTMAASTVSA
jgi:hypothetical protein